MAHRQSGTGQEARTQGHPGRSAPAQGSFLQNESHYSGPESMLPRSEAQQTLALQLCELQRQQQLTFGHLALSRAFCSQLCVRQ